MGAAASLKSQEFVRDPAKWRSIGYAFLDVEQFALCSCTCAKVSKLLYEVLDEATLFSSLKTYAKLHPWFRPERAAITPSLPGGGVCAFIEFRLLNFQYRVVCYREGISLDDWMNEVSFGAHERAPIFDNLHAGFVQRALDVPAKLAVFLNGSSVRDMPVIFTGHSMGGAIAEVAALPVLHHENVFVITFGSPSVANSHAAWADSFPSGKKICRYYFPDDPIPPIVSSACPTKDFEFLVKVDGGTFTHTATIEVGAATSHLNLSFRSAPRSSRVEVSSSSGGHRHDLKAVVEEVMQVTALKEKHVSHRYLSEFVGQFADIAFKPVAIDIIPLDMHAEDINARIEYINHRIVLVVSGLGLNIENTRASFLFHGALQGDQHRHQFHAVTDVVVGTLQEVVSAKTPHPLLVRKTRFESWFDVTNVTMSFSKDDEISVRYRVSNGFETHTWQAVLKPLRSIVFVGQVGHGKSHLVESLYHSLQGVPYAGFDSGWEQADDHKSHSFLHNGVLYYELPGLVAASGTFQKKIETKFHELSPSAMVVVFKSGEKFSPEGLPRMMESLRELTAGVRGLSTYELEDVIRISLVLTMAPPFTKSPESISQLLQGLGLRSTTRVFQVNSVDLTYGDMVVPRQGINELQEYLVEVSKKPSLLSADLLNRWWTALIWKYTGVVVALFGAAITTYAVLSS